MRPSWWFDIVATDDQLPCIRSGELKEFDSIVEDGEDNDYYDIAETVTNTPLKYRMKAGFMSTLWWIRRMRTISIWFTKRSILYVYFCMYQGVANIRIFEYIRIFSSMNIRSHHFFDANIFRYSFVLFFWYEYIRIFVRIIFLYEYVRIFVRIVFYSNIFKRKI